MASNHYTDDQPVDPTRQNPSMFEPTHGSAFFITGMGVANPVGTLSTASEMLAWLGEEQAARKLMESVEFVTERGIATRDFGETAGTKDVTDAICKELEKMYSGSGK
jgi:isocitrate/isopropylmalate dehydrogenase